MRPAILSPFVLATSIGCTSINIDRLPPDSGRVQPDVDARPSPCDAGACTKKATRSDATGDGRADLLLVRTDGISVAPSTGSSFASPVRWISVESIRTVATTVTLTAKNVFFGDVSGDGQVDAILVDATVVWVMRSEGGHFSAPTKWNDYAAPTQASGGAPVAIAFADVTGDGAADAVFATTERVYVMVSNATSFRLAQNWTDGKFYGASDTVLADVDGDGMADIVAAPGYDKKIYAMSSTGSSFDGYMNWTEVEVDPKSRFDAADVTGDGYADLLEVPSANALIVRASNGSKFVDPQVWTDESVSLPFLAADVTGDGKADLVTIEPDGVDVRVSTGSHFEPAQRWLEGAP